MLIRKKSGEVIEVETPEVMDLADFVALTGREDDPLVVALVSEIRRMNSILSNLPAQIPPTVNVQPSITPPSVSVSPRVEVTAPLRWHVPIKRHTFGPFQGQIESVEFIAMQP